MKKRTELTSRQHRAIERKRMARKARRKMERGPTRKRTTSRFANFPGWYGEGWA
jgi:hypothetical protein